MTNYEILAAFQRTRDSIENLDGFVTKLRSLARRKKKIAEAFAAISAFDNKQGSHLSSLSAELQEAQAEMKQFSSRMFFGSAFSLATIFRDLLREINEVEPVTSRILHALNHLENTFDEYTQHHTSSRVMAVIMQAHEFIEQLDSFGTYVELLEQVFALDNEPKEYEDELTLYLPATLTFEEFISRLNSINVIYRELSDIIGVSTSDQPLRIGKVESGSLLATLFGNSTVITLLSDLLRGGAKYWQRNRSPEGKMNAIPPSIKAMDDLFDFSKKLQDAGADVKPIHDELVKGSILIAKNLNKLFESQSSVVINGEDIPLADGDENGRLENRRVPRLENDAIED